MLFQYFLGAAAVVAMTFFYAGMMKPDPKTWFYRRR